ncbi:MAG: MFS transporter [Sphingobacteriales bacterium]|nr:MAG: MFS transporter [Sphingobacteriales bacterium]
MKPRFNLPQSLSPLHEKEFRFFVTARFFLIMALRMVGTVVAYELFQITKSSFSIGLVGLSEFVPVFSLALYAGHIIDRSDKRKILLRGIFCYGLCIVALIVVTVPAVQQLFNKHLLEISFYAVIFGTGITRAFVGPTTNAIISQLVPRNILPLAANISSSTWLVASILGHASAGFFIAWFGVNTTFTIILVYAVTAAIVISFIKPKPIVAKNIDIGAWDSVKEGLQFVRSNKIMLGAISLDLFAVLFGGAVALIPEFANKILNVGPIGFGWLNAAIDIGSVIIIVTLTFFPMKKHQGYKLFFAVAGFGLCIITFGFSTNFWLSFFAMVMAGVFDGISVIVRGTVLQLTTPDEMRGRVGSVNSMFINSSNELGQFESGFTSRIMGTVPAVIFGGTMTLLVVIITWFKAPKLRKFEY